MGALLARVQTAIIQEQEVLCLDKVIDLLIVPEDHHLASVQSLSSCGAACEGTQPCKSWKAPLQPWQG